MSICFVSLLCTINYNIIVRNNAAKKSAKISFVALMLFKIAD